MPGVAFRLLAPTPAVWMRYAAFAPPKSGDMISPVRLRDDTSKWNWDHRSQALLPFVRGCFPRSLSSDQRWTRTGILERVIDERELESWSAWALWRWHTFCTGVQGTATAPLIFLK